MQNNDVSKLEEVGELALKRSRLYSLLNRNYLHFPEPYETAYRRYLFDDYQYILRIGTIIGYFLWLFFGYIDILAASQSLNVFLFIRLVLVGPIIGFFLIFSLTSFYIKTFFIQKSTTAFFAGMGILMMILVSKPNELAFYYYIFGVMVVLVFLYCLPGGLFYSTILVGGILVIAYQMVCFIQYYFFGYHLNLTLYLIYNSFFVSTALIGSIANYYYEITTRRNFIQQQIIFDDEEDLEKKNIELNATLDRLHKTQEQLVLNEKMAALGTLFASIAHEINTPLGVINASSSNILNSASNLIKNIDSVTTISKMKHFLPLLQRSIESKNLFLTSLEIREYKERLEKYLTMNNIVPADQISELLIDMGIYHDIDEFLPFFQNQDDLILIPLVYDIASLYRNSNNISESVNRASKIIFALKNFSHYEHISKKVMANIKDGIETVLTLYQHQMKSKIKLIRNYQYVPPILCYPDELNQVWINLIQNALYVMQSTGGTLTIDLYKQDHYLVVDITDTGSGIPSKIRDKLFQPFITTKPSGEGSGLGLSIVKKIVEKHNGKINFESVPGKTTFTVFLPM